MKVHSDKIIYTSFLLFVLIISTQTLLGVESGLAIYERDVMDLEEPTSPIDSSNIQLASNDIRSRLLDRFGLNSSPDNLVYTAAELTESDIIINRIGGLADPSNIQLSDDFPDSERADIAVFGNNVHVVWDSDSSEIMYRRSTDGGATYSNAVILSDGLTDSNSQNPSITVVGNTVYVIWSDAGQILLRKSTDGRINFGTPVLVSVLTHAPGGPAVIDSMAIGNNVYVVWSENVTGGENGDEIFFSYSSDGGVTFTQKINLSSNNRDSNSPSIAVFRNNVHVVWSDDSVLSSGHGEILYRKSSDGGKTFNVAKNISNTPLGSGNPSIAAVQNRLYIVWEDQIATENFDIMFKTSTNGGTSFGPIKNLSSNIGDSRGAEIAASQNDIYVVWADETGNVVGRDIFFVRSINSGDTFGATTIIIPDANRPAITISQNIA